MSITMLLPNTIQSHDLARDFRIMKKIKALTGTVCRISHSGEEGGVRDIPYPSMTIISICTFKLLQHVEA